MNKYGCTQIYIYIYMFLFPLLLFRHYSYSILLLSLFLLSLFLSLFLLLLYIPYIVCPLGLTSHRPRNSYSGWALVAEGMLLGSPTLTVVGSLIGFSGTSLAPRWGGWDGMDKTEESDEWVTVHDVIYMFFF